ncbi:MAG TPA: glycosyltransferase [Gammaproteobacteria bacterium]|nr:glycosyltransferase [Gammaproteobacteria bacterium]
MRVLNLTYTDVLSGAGIATMRLHFALRNAGVDSTMMVMRKYSAHESIETTGSKLAFSSCAIRQMATKRILGLAGARRGETLSANFFPTGLHRTINRIAPDVVHLHWVGAEMIQIEEVRKIKCPIIWTLHDEWAVIGLEHYSPVPVEFREIAGVQEGERSKAFIRLDNWNRARKKLSWQAKQPQFVAPSRWLSMRANDEMAGVVPPASTIPNTVPLHIFRPISKKEARHQLELPEKDIIVAFGAVAGTSDPRKGYFLLRKALERVVDSVGAKNLTFLVFGNSGRVSELIPNLRCRFSGVINSADRLAYHYAAADVFVCPSLQENLPNTVAEAISCGTPCVGFSIGGLSDLIDHGENGYLARPFDASDLAHGIETVLGLPDAARRSARTKSLEVLAGERVAASYQALYKQGLS